MSYIFHTHPQNPLPFEKGGGSPRVIGGGGEYEIRHYIVPITYKSIIIIFHHKRTVFPDHSLLLNKSILYTSSARFSTLLVDFFFPMWFFQKISGTAA
jgi:hypothetical protein